MIILTSENALQLFAIFSIAGFLSSNIARKSIYDIFNRYSLHYKVKRKSTSLHIAHTEWFIGSNGSILVH